MEIRGCFIEVDIEVPHWDVLDVNLVMIKKKDLAQTPADLRPISIPNTLVCLVQRWVAKVMDLSPITLSFPQSVPFHNHIIIWNVYVLPVLSYIMRFHSLLQQQVNGIVQAHLLPIQNLLGDKENHPFLSNRDDWNTLLKKLLTPQPTKTLSTTSSCSSQGTVPSASLFFSFFLFFLTNNAKTHQHPSSFQFVVVGSGIVS